MHTYIHIYAYMYTHIYISVYIYIHICTFIQVGREADASAEDCVALAHYIVCEGAALGVYIYMYARAYRWGGRQILTTTVWH